MKKFIISRSTYSLFAVLGIGLLSSCDKNIHDFAKKTGSDADRAVYIADSIFTFPVFTGVNGESFGVDTILAKFPVRLSQAAESDVTATVVVDNELIDVYNARHGKHYKKFPDSRLSRTTVTIKQGQMESSDSIVVMFPKNPRELPDTNGYLLPVRIVSYGGTDVKIDYERRVAYLIASVALQNGVHFKPLENSAGITNNPALGVFNPLDAIDFTLYSISEMDEDVKVTLSVNNSLIAAYNSRLGTDYQAIPDTDFEEVEVTIPGGTDSGTATIPYKGEDPSTLNDTKGYVVPLEIKSVTGSDMGIVDAEKVFYVVIDVSNLHSTLVVDGSELGTKVTTRTGYSVVKFVNSATGAAVTLLGGMKPENMFAGQQWISMNIKLDLTVDLGEEVRNISGLWLEGWNTVAGNNMKAVDIYYATAQMYAAGKSSLAGMISLATGQQMWYIQFSEPVDARYIMFNNMTPAGTMVGFKQFYICTND